MGNGGKQMARELLARELCHNSFIRAHENDSAASLAGQFLERKENHALVFAEDDSYLGVITKEGFLKKHVDLAAVKVKSLVKGKPVLYGDDSLSKIAELMFSSEARVLPVFDDKKMIGVVTARDVVFELEKDEKTRSIPVQQAASMAPFTLPENASVEQAISLLQSKKINRIPLVSSTGELAGLFSFSDVLRNVALHEHRRPKGRQQKEKARSESSHVMKSPVKEFSSEYPETIHANDSLAVALQKMREKNLSSLVLTEKGKPTGILTLRDLLKIQVKSQKPEANVQFSNKPVLDEIDSAFLEKKMGNFLEKFSRKFSSEIFLQVHCKPENKKGTRKQHFIKMHLTGPGINLTAKVRDWKFLSAVQQGLKSLETEAEKRQWKR